MKRMLALIRPCVADALQLKETLKIKMLGRDKATDNIHTPTIAAAILPLVLKCKVVVFLTTLIYLTRKYWEFVN